MISSFLSLPSFPPSLLSSLHPSIPLLSLPSPPQDKPILARIKTKPMSRLGCLSVLPSYGGKAGGAGCETKEGQGSATAPPLAQPSPGAAAGGGRGGAPGASAQTGGNYAPTSGAGRFMFSTQQPVNPGSYTYTYTAPSSPMPTAYVRICVCVRVSVCVCVCVFVCVCVCLS